MSRAGRGSSVGQPMRSSVRVQAVRWFGARDVAHSTALRILPCDSAVGAVGTAASALREFIRVARQPRCCFVQQRKVVRDLRGSDRPAAAVEVGGRRGRATDPAARGFRAWIASISAKPSRSPRRMAANSASSPASACANVVSSAEDDDVGPPLGLPVTARPFGLRPARAPATRPTNPCAAHRLRSGVTDLLAVPPRSHALRVGALPRRGVRDSRANRV